MIHVQVQSIRLTEFHYNPDYVVTEVAPITYQLQVLNRVPEHGESLEITVSIRYEAPDNDCFLLSAACRTVFRVPGMTRLEDPETGRPVVDVPEELLQYMTGDAVAHARALVAAHTTGTWLEQCHVALGGPVGRADATCSADARALNSEAK